MSRQQEPFAFPSQDDLASEIKAFWKDHNPRLHAELLQKGELAARSKEAAADALRYAHLLVSKQGMRPAEAWEVASQERAFAHWDAM